MRDFIAVGENIHCTRIYKVGGRYVRKQPDGGHAITYRDGRKERLLPVPAAFLEGSDWEANNVRHTAVAVWQGLHGGSAGQEAGRAFIRSLAGEQEAASAAYLDVNVDQFSTQTEERTRAIRWAVEVIRECSALPLSIDSSNVDVLAAGLEACAGSAARPLVNSVSLERRDAIGVAKAAGAVVIAGATGETSMPNSREERMANTERLVNELTAVGFGLRDIYLDPLVFPVSVDSSNGVVLLESIRALRARYGEEIHFAPGLSNISFGMPRRKLINQVFAYLCVQEGLDGGIVDPLQVNHVILQDLDTASEAFAMTRDFLMGTDEFGMNYIAAAREGRI